MVLLRLLMVMGPLLLLFLAMGRLPRATTALLPSAGRHDDWGWNVRVGLRELDSVWQNGGAWHRCRQLYPLGGNVGGGCSNRLLRAQASCGGSTVDHWRDAGLAGCVALQGGR